METYGSILRHSPSLLIPVHNVFDCMVKLLWPLRFLTDMQISLHQSDQLFNGVQISVTQHTHSQTHIQTQTIEIWKSTTAVGVFGQNELNSCWSLIWGNDITWFIFNREEKQTDQIVTVYIIFIVLQTMWYSVCRFLVWIASINISVPVFK